MFHISQARCLKIKLYVLTVTSFSVEWGMGGGGNFYDNKARKKIIIVIAVFENILRDGRK